MGPHFKYNIAQKINFDLTPEPPFKRLHKILKVSKSSKKIRKNVKYPRIFYRGIHMHVELSLRSSAKPCYEQYDMPTRTIISSTDHMRMASHQRFLPCVVSRKYYM